MSLNSCTHYQNNTLISFHKHVRVGLCIPPSEIISLIAFHFLGVSYSSFICIPLGPCYNLTEGPCYLFPSCLVPTGLGLFIKVHKNHFPINDSQYLVSWSAKGHFIHQVQGLVNSIFKVSNNASRPEGGSKQVFILKISSSYCWTMTFLQNSVLKKIRHFVFCNILPCKFQNFSILGYFRCSLGHPLPKSNAIIPAKNFQEVHHLSQKSKETTKTEFVLESEKVPKQKQQESGFHELKFQKLLVYKQCLHVISSFAKEK